MKLRFTSYAAIWLLCWAGVANAQEKKFASDQGTPDKKFMRGAKRTPPQDIAKAVATGKAKVFLPVVAAPQKISFMLDRLSVWGNDRYGDCVTAENGFSIGGYSKNKTGKQIFITEQAVIDWARAHGVLNGADLLSVIQWMQRDGIKDENGNLWKEGVPSIVDFNNEGHLQDANSQGPLSIAIAADSLPSGAGNQDGWYSFGSRNDHNTDHCVPILGYGPPDFIFGVLGKPVPAGAPATVYLLGTWGTVGVVDHAWIKGTTDEAWLRTPTVVGLAPTPPDPPVGGIAISPASVTLGPKGVQQFTSVPVADTWITKDGTVTQTGLYTAPEATGKYTVAAVTFSPFAVAQATITVSATPPPPTGPRIVIGPDVTPGVYVQLKADEEIAKIGTTAKLETIMRTLQAPTQAPPTPEQPVIEKKETPKPPEPKEEKKEEVRCEDQDQFAYWLEQARQRNMPFVVGVGCEPVDGDWLIAKTDKIETERRTIEGPNVVLMRGNVVLFVYPPTVSASTIERRLGIVRNPKDPKPYPKKAE